MKPHAVRRGLLLCGASLVVGLLSPLDGHAQEQLDDEALRAVVRIFSHGPNRMVNRRPVPGDEGGAGIVVGMDRTAVYVATALHVVALDVAPWLRADSILVQFHGTELQVKAEIHTAAPMRVDTLLVHTDSVTLDTIPPVDLALLRVERLWPDSVDSGKVFVATGYGDVVAFTPAWDRLGDTGALRPGSLVFPVGCPQGRCWETGAGEPVFSANQVEVLVQGDVVRGGHSGGALFDATGEVVGMLIESTGPGGRAYSMDFVVSSLKELKAWERPVTIAPPRYPRAGYAVTAGASFLAPLSGDAVANGRAPSARLSVGFPLTATIEAHVGLLRLAPGSLGSRCPLPVPSDAPLSEVVVGRERRPCEQVAHMLTWGVGRAWGGSRFMVRPFGELAMGRVAARHDLGGVYVAADSRYLPHYEVNEETGFGAGAGVTVDFAFLPHFVLRAVGGYWTLQDPFEKLDLPEGYRPSAPKGYWGLGLRWGG